MLSSQTKTRTPFSIRASGRRGIASRAPDAASPQRSGNEKAKRSSAYIEYKNLHPAMEVALYYGFTPLDSPVIITKKDRDRARSIQEEMRTDPFSVAPTLEERIALLRQYGEKKVNEGMQPVMFCSELLPGAAQRRKPDDRLVLLEIIGSGKSIADATIIQTAFATLREAKHENLTLHINSIGDRESTGHFTRELGNYYRRHAASLPNSCKTLLRINPLEILRCQHALCRGLSDGAPKSIGFLGEGSRRHFKEVLEFLEELEIPYQIDHALSGGRSFAAETVFEIRETLPESEPVGANLHSPETGLVPRGNSRCLSAGIRYNTLGKRLGLNKHDVPSIGLNLIVPNADKEWRPSRHFRFRKPSVFFLQLGFYAKLKSLRVIEILRKARIPIYQALGRDKLVSQLSAAENLHIPYSIILGQREALENSVIIRNTTTRAQETVKIPDLVECLRKMKLG
ncbi:MAG: His/Gly/Thr/Pro-type tRNA ligase C-terminal domain-containing protein [Patescibacteria group bacterium]